MTRRNDIPAHHAPADLQGQATCRSCVCLGFLNNRRAPPRHLWRSRMTFCRQVLTPTADLDEPHYCAYYAPCGAGTY